MGRNRYTLSLMVLTIFLAGAAQVYWLLKLYDDEYANLKKGVDARFRNGFNRLQRERFLKDSLLFTEVVDSIPRESGHAATARKRKSDRPKVSVQMQLYSVGFDKTASIEELERIPPDEIESIRVVKPGGRSTLPPELMEVFIKQTGEKNRRNDKSDTTRKGERLAIKSIFLAETRDSTVSKKRNSKENIEARPKGGKSVSVESQIEALNLPVVRLFRENKTLNDSIPLKDVDRALRQSLPPEMSDLYFLILSRKWMRGDVPGMDEPRDTANGFITSAQYAGFTTPFTYQALFPRTSNHVLMGMRWQIAGSILFMILLVSAFALLYQTLRRQQRLAEMKNEFVNNVTHELKTPIATVNVALEALKSFNVLEEPIKAKEYLDISVAEIGRLGALVDNVLERSLQENDAIRLDLTTFNMQSLIEEVLRTMRVRFEKTNAHVEFEKEGAGFAVTADRLQIASVVYNLLDNALKYSAGKPEIAIRLSNVSDGMLLEVGDRGIGIPKTYRDKIFQPFFRVPTHDRHDANGHGLGLCHVAHILRLLNGRIDVTDRKGGGSLFTIHLPTA